MISATGDRVELVSADYKGTVEYADATHVRVKWDEGHVGLLYFDGSARLAKARHLQKLVGLGSQFL